MSQDISRILQNPRNDYLGVLLQQGRPLTDADWNELVAELLRRTQAGTLDTFGPAVVPEQTPAGFQITAAGAGFTVGPGRIYVDGVLAESHGGGTLQWDPRLAELRGGDALAYSAQPYLPQPPALPALPYVVYLDVWQREVGPLQDPSLLEKALGGVDTTSRLQTVWQVRALGGVAATADCATPGDALAGWNALTAPSAGRLSTATGKVAGEPDPCLVPPAGGYKGGENQLYRVEVHEGGALGTASFKWSRDNASVQASVLRIPDALHIVVDTVGRDEVLRFNDGDWIEITDDAIELGGAPGGELGVLRRIAVGGGVDDGTRTITLASALPAGRFPVDAQGVPTGGRHPRVQRWDQGGIVKRADGSTYTDLDAAGSSGAITVPTGSTQLLLEAGVLVGFSVAQAGGRFRRGDWWVFAARSGDASIEVLDRAPPRGVHHHYARLAVVSAAGVQDCRQFWPPRGGCCTVVVAPGQNVQAAIDSLPARGGCVCLKAGEHRIGQTLLLARSRVLLHGESLAARIVGDGVATLLRVGGGEAQVRDVEIAMLAFETASAGKGALVEALGCSGLQVRGNSLRYTGPAPQGGVGVMLMRCASAGVEGNAIEGCTVGVLATASVDVTISGNALRGDWRPAPGAPFPTARQGLLIQTVAGAVCRDNQITEFLVGVQLDEGAAGATVADNRIARAALQASTGDLPSPDRRLYAIDGAARDLCITGNRIDIASPLFGGVRVTGTGAHIAGNHVDSSVEGSELALGVLVGIWDGEAVGPGDRSVVAGNHFSGTLLAIAASRTRGVAIRNNEIDLPGRAAGGGVVLRAASETRVDGNRIRGGLIGVTSSPEAPFGCIANRLLGNDIAGTTAGIFSSGDTDVEIDDNGIVDAQVFGIYAALAGSSRLLRNRVDHCGHLGGDQNLGIAVVLAVISGAPAGTLTIASCRVADTGISPNPAVVVGGAAWGLLCTGFAELRLLDNEFRVDRASRLSPDAEHRAAVLVGPPAAGVAGRFAAGVAEVRGNLFQGPGRSSLLNVGTVSGNTTLGFATALFNANRCEHATSAGDAATTVVFAGFSAWRCSIVNNHIEAPGAVASVYAALPTRIVVMGNSSTGLLRAISNDPANANVTPRNYLDFNARV